MDTSVGNLLHVLTGIVLLAFIGIGIAHIVNPDRFIARSGAPKSAGLLAWNRLAVRIFGAVFTGAALFMLYDLISG
jgi:hypothetical protein